MRTLRLRLNLMFLALALLIGLGYLALTLFSTKIYIQETMQRLNSAVARQIVSENQFFKDGELTTDQLDGLFHSLMVINPSVEFYLTDPEGRILVYDAPTDRMVRMSIDVAPIKSFIENGEDALILGDDPRHLNRQKPFSAAPIYENDALRGYLYAILGGEDFEDISDRFERSHALRLMVAAGVIGLVSVLGLGWLSFQRQTKKLKELSASVSEIESRALNPENIAAPKPAAPEDMGDEIDRLERTINNLSQRVSTQITQLQEADAVRREMLLNISHDLRTPMTILQGYLETLQMKAATNLDATNSAYLERANLQCQQMNRLITAVFELATLEAGERKPQVEPFSLAELMQDVGLKFTLQAQSKGIDLTLDIAEDLPLIEADLALMERVLDNLIDNALKQTPSGGAVSVSARKSGDHIALKISDTGHGIAPEDLPKIFDRFYRASNSAGDGTGLGLPIVLRILDLHGAALDVKSALGQGTQIHVSLPLKAA